MKPSGGGQPEKSENSNILKNKSKIIWIYTNHLVPLSIERNLNRKKMKTQKYNIRGTEINKAQFSEIEGYLEEKGFNADQWFSMMADENEMIYVSNGFVKGLKSDENEAGEWHHYFKKESDGSFSAYKMSFSA